MSIASVLNRKAKEIPMSRFEPFTDTKAIALDILESAWFAPPPARPRGRMARWLTAVALTLELAVFVWSLLVAPSLLPM